MTNSFLYCSLPTRRLLAVGLVVLGLAPAPSQGGDTTYSEHVAPILQEKCVACHREGESAPFRLDDYASASRRARTLLRVVDARQMPPWHAIGGDVPLLGDRRLMPEQIAVLRDWVEGGKVEGDPDKLPPLRQFAEGWQLGEPDLVLTMDQAYALPAEGDDIYRNFVLPSGLTRERFVKAIEYRPSTAEVVHHAIIFVDTQGRARRVDAADTEPGFAEMPIGEGTGRQIGAWVPGTQPRPLPEGLAHRLPAESDIVVQLHFHLTGKREREQSEIAFYFDDHAPKQSFTSIQLPPIFGAFSGIDLEPGAADSSVTDSFVLPVAVRAFGAQPHSHYRGRSLNLTAELPDGQSLVLLNIPRWDMDWQEEYRFAEQVELPAGTRLTSQVVWDNSTASVDNPVQPPVRVRWGLESYDEMGSIDLFVIPVGKGKSGKAQKHAMTELRNRYRDHVVWSAGSHVLSADKLAVFGELRQKAITRFDLDGDGRLDGDEREAARRALSRRVSP